MKIKICGITRFEDVSKCDRRVQAHPAGCVADRNPGDDRVGLAVVGEDSVYQ